ncbi:Dinitrogenase iron-molybdenum cofactor [compost metagenome]
MKVAFATDDGLKVNSHFGQSPMFSVYEVRPGEANFVENRPVPVQISQDEGSRIEMRIHLIEDCTLVFLMQIGASAAARVTSRKMMPVKVPAGSSIEDQIARLLDMLRGKPPMWLSKVLQAEQSGSREELSNEIRSEG